MTDRELNLKHLLERIEYLPEDPGLDLRLLELEKHMESLFSQVHSSGDIEESRPFFNVLAKIHHVLCIVAFKEGKELTPHLREFVRDFDRVDMYSEFSRLFKMIKDDEHLKRWVRPGRES